MADPGNNNEDVAQMKAKIKELTDKVSELSKELEKQQTIVDNAEKKFNEMSAETGASRKAVAEAAQEVLAARNAEKKSQEDLRKLASELAEAKKMLGPGGEDGSNRGGTARTADEIEESLTDEERKYVEGIWKTLSPDQRAAYMSDDAVRKACLVEAKAAAIAGEPDLSSPWKKPAQQRSSSGDGDAESIRKLFRRENKRASNLPDGGGGSPRAGRVQAERPLAARTTNALIG